MGLRARSSPTARQLDRAHLGRSGEADELQIVRADGSFVFDVDGSKYIDFVMGWSVGNLGWNPVELRERVRRYDGPDYVSPAALHRPWGELATLLAEITPGELTQEFLAVDGVYHGNTLAIRALARHAIRPPLDEAALERVESALRKRDVAAFIMEPIVCNLGALAPTPGFMRGLGALCRRYGTLFVADEVASGFGRTGKLFACEHYELEPDLMCMAKALSAGLLPIGATIMTDEVYEALGDDFSFYSTYGWHPLAVEAAIANVKHWKRHARALLDNVNARGAELEAGLVDVDFGRAADVRATGLAIAIGFEDEAYALDVIATAAAAPRTRSCSPSWSPASAASRACSTDRRPSRASTCRSR